MSQRTRRRTSGNSAARLNSLDRFVMRRRSGSLRWVNGEASKYDMPSFSKSPQNSPWATAHRASSVPGYGCSTVALAWSMPQATLSAKVRKASSTDSRGMPSMLKAMTVNPAALRRRHPARMSASFTGRCSTSRLKRSAPHSSPTPTPVHPASTRVPTILSVARSGRSLQKKGSPIRRRYTAANLCNQRQSATKFASRNQTSLRPHRSRTRSMSSARRSGSVVRISGPYGRFRSFSVRLKQ